MKIKVGEKIPSTEFFHIDGGGTVKKVKSIEILAKQKAIVIGVPGAFTKVCSAQHLPGYVNNFEEAIKLINKHQFGNGTSIYTSSGSLARNFMKNVQIGMVGINIPIPVPMSFYTFGGWKGSIFGGHGMHGEEGINFYTKRKTITSRWPDDVAGASLNMPTMK